MPYVLLGGFRHNFLPRVWRVFNDTPFLSFIYCFLPFVERRGEGLLLYIYISLPMISVRSDGNVHGV